MTTTGQTPPAKQARSRAAALRELLADDREQVADARDRAADDREQDTELREMLSEGRAEIAERELAGLKTAMKTRAVIEQAKGMVMLTLKIDADAAFDVLVRRSQASHRKLVEVAKEVVATGISRDD